MMSHLLFLAAGLSALLLGGCTSIPDGTRAVTGFDLDRYLGKWYEIARLDHSFEEGLDCVTAEYSLRDDGGVRVINRGVNLSEAQENVAEGKAYFEGDEDVGRLKVSFFGPFYAGYNVLALDDDYDWAMVAGPDRDYFWILTRTPTLEDGLYRELVELAAALDFPVDELINVEQGEACREWRQDA